MSEAHLYWFVPSMLPGLYALLVGSEESRAEGGSTGISESRADGGVAGRWLR